MIFNELTMLGEFSQGFWVWGKKTLAFITLFPSQSNKVPYKLLKHIIKNVQCLKRNTASAYNRYQILE